MFRSMPLGCEDLTPVPVVAPVVVPEPTAGVEEVRPLPDVAEWADGVVPLTAGVLEVKPLPVGWLEVVVDPVEPSPLPVG